MRTWGPILALLTASSALVAPRTLPAQATNCVLPSLPEQAANPMTATLQNGDARSAYRILLGNTRAESTVRDESYSAWLVKTAHSRPPGTLWPTIIFNSYAQPLSGAEKIDWRRVNYLLNHKHGTVTDVQQALMILTGALLPVSASSHSVSVTAKQMLAETRLNGGAFVPAPGQVCGVVLDAGSQRGFYVLEVLCPTGPVDSCHIADWLWDDLNADGLWNNAEPAISGAALELRDLSGQMVASGSSAMNGSVTLPFVSVLPGYFTLRLMEFARYTRPTLALSPLTNAGSSRVFGLDSDCLLMAEDNPATISGNVWVDANRNGRRDLAERGLPGMTVRLHHAPGDVLQAVRTTIGGAYAFAVLQPETYFVSFELPAGFEFTKPRADHPARDSDVLYAPGLTPLLTLSAGQVEAHLDAGLCKARRAGVRSAIERPVGSAHRAAFP